MAKIRQREWAIPGQRTPRKAWGYVSAMPGKHRSKCQRPGCAGCYQVRRFQSEWTYDDAVKALAEVMRDAPVVAQSDGLTVGAYADRWLTTVTADLEPKTMESYRETLTRHIRPALGVVSLAALTRGQVKALLAAKRAAGLGKNSVRIIRAVLSVMLNDAVEDGVLASNPATGIGRGRRKRGGAISQAERRQQIRPLSLEQLAAFLATSGREPQREAVLFLTLADTGMRPGEAPALKWEDVGLAGRSLRVARALSGQRIKGTKTGEIRDVEARCHSPSVT